MSASGRCISITGNPQTLPAKEVYKMPIKETRYVPSDIEIAQAHEMKPVKEIMAMIGLTEDDVDYYGKYKAKVHLDVLDGLADRPSGKYIDVTAITPTPLGEGKTVTTIGVSQGLYY